VGLLSLDLFPFQEAPVLLGFTGTSAGSEYLLLEMLPEFGSCYLRTNGAFNIACATSFTESWRMSS